jgi:hypothetical protein
MNNEDQVKRDFMDEYAEDGFFENFMKSELNRHKSK